MKEELTKISWRTAEGKQPEICLSLTLDGNTIILDYGEVQEEQITVTDMLALSKTDAVLMIQALKLMVQEM